MRTLLAFSVLSLFFFTSYAQYDPEMNREERQEYENRLRENEEYWKKMGVRSKTIYRVEDSDSIPTWHYEFDREGRTANSTQYRKNGKEKERWDFTWDEQGRMTSNRKSRNGKELSGANWTYRGSNPDPVEIVWKGKKGKIDTRIVHKFDEEQNVVLTQTYYGKNASKPGWRYEYDYYENGSKKEARYYDPKGKLKEVYTYDCNMVPKTEKEMMKDTVKACIKYETDAEGNKVKIIEEQDEKGHMKITRLTYNKNKYLIAARTTDYKGRLLTEYTCERNSQDNVTRYTNQYRKGLRTIKVAYTYQYDDEGKIVVAEGFKNNKPEQYLNSYTKF